MRSVSPPRVLTSSSWTILMTCWAGLRDLDSSAPTARSLILATKLRTTLKLTSASSRATRISRSTSSTPASLSRPLPRRRRKMPTNRSERASNMRPVMLSAPLGLRPRRRCGSSLALPSPPLSAPLGLVVCATRRSASPARPSATDERDSCCSARRLRSVPRCRRGDAALLEEGVDELVGVEVDKVVGLLAEADQLDRDAEVLLDRKDDAALGRPVELGQYHAGDVDCLGELAGLDQPVLTGGGVEHEQHLGHPARLAIRDPANLAQLVHEVDLGVE